MSQSRIRAGLDAQHSQDWMQELEADANQFQAVVTRVDQLAGRAIHDIAVRKDYVTAGMRLAEIQEGLQLLCQLAGIKVNPYVASA